MAKRKHRPKPCRRVQQQQDAVDAGDFGSYIACGIVKYGAQSRPRVAGFLGEFSVVVGVNAASSLNDERARRR